MCLRYMSSFLSISVLSAFIESYLLNLCSGLFESSLDSSICTCVPQGLRCNPELLQLSE